MRFFEWCAELRGLDGHHCLLVAAKATTAAERHEVLQSARKAFSEVQMITPPIVDESGWPGSCNTLFKAACAYVKSEIKQPWLWTEPDCVLLSEDGLEKIERAYMRFGKPYMGVIFDQPVRHMTGVGVYPPDVMRFNPGIQRPINQPWDCIAPEITLAHFVETDLIQHVWGDVATNTAPTFPNAESLDLLAPSAVLFHRCKDGSLIERLRERSLPPSTATQPATREISSPPPPRPAQKAQVGIVQLARLGDILNILPVAREMALRSGEAPVLMVQKDYASILESVSYVRPEVWNEGAERSEDAARFLGSKCRHVRVAQVWGQSTPKARVHENFAREQWARLGHIEHWGKLPLVLDRRDPQREFQLLNRIPGGQPLIVVCFDAVSAPFPHGPAVLACLQSAIP